MRLSPIIEEYYDAFLTRYGDRALPEQIKALNAILRCRTPDAGQIYTVCPDCNHTQLHPLSCGNRNCPHCQNHETSQWIDRQQNKQLPVQYFMVTFTLPCQFRKVAYRNQRTVYSLMFSCVSSTLKEFGLNPRHLGAQIGMTMVLHTHSRRLDFHPHIHVVVPGGGVDPSRRQWKKKKGKYLFNQKALARVFRARFLDGLNKKQLPIPKGARPKWVVDCARGGTGMSALKYLSRYLYRGVISERNIIANQDGRVTFRYIDGKTKEVCTRTLKGEDFLHLILRHVLPRGFRRVRDYGFLHGNAKKLLFLVQMILQVRIMAIVRRTRPVFKCPHCGKPMKILGVKPTGAG
ncbi:IS91 family transposase [uncultured Desulfobacter sp.]|uniref:IS91 family transposase n=1 Tax=uncultured Desulfobacter sp. TaxID=240139 RepID=UPI002AA6840E|nr:IS91 family transposase [uncultured Desulfobacter sp.]